MESILEMTESESLLRVVVHDISTPITISQIIIKRLKRSSTYIDNKKEIETLEAANSAVIDVLEQVRLLASARGGKVPLCLKSMNASEICQLTINFYENIALAKGIQLRFSCANPEAVIMVEPAIFKTVVLGNLISNAIKFSQPNSNIEVGLFEEGGCIVFEIQDFGVGVPPDMRSIIFDPTKPTHRPGTKGESGTGFGLPLVKQFVELMNGAVELSTFHESQQPNFTGTTFRVLMPKVS